MANDVAIALAIIFGSFFVGSVALLYFMCKKHHRGLFSMRFAFRTLPDDPYGESTDAIQEEMTGDQESAMEHETHVTFLIPYGLQMLKSCKTLTHRLMATAIDGTSKDQSNLISGSLDDIIAAAKEVNPRVDDLTKTMYPPIEDETIRFRATSLMTAVNHLVAVFTENCVHHRLHWLDGLTSDVFHDYQALTRNIDRCREMRKQEDIIC